MSAGFDSARTAFIALRAAGLASAFIAGWLAASAFSPNTESKEREDARRWAEMQYAEEMRHKQAGEAKRGRRSAEEYRRAQEQPQRERDEASRESRNWPGL